MATNQPPVTMSVSCRFEHHGAAASSRRQVITWIPAVAEETKNDPKDAATTGNTDTDNSDCLVYASHAMINLAERRAVLLPGNGVVEDPIWTVRHTLRTSLLKQCTANPGDVPMQITLLMMLVIMNGNGNGAGHPCHSSSFPFSTGIICS